MVDVNANGTSPEEVTLLDKDGNPIDSTHPLNTSAAVASIAAGDNNIGNVDLASALPAGTNQIGEVGITDTYAPVGAHSSGATISSATTLTKPEGANQILIQALIQNVRFTLDGTTPTTTVGFQLLAGNPPVIIAVPGASMKVIEEAATASLQYQWIG
jgi:hypothetical protein